MSLADRHRRQVHPVGHVPNGIDRGHAGLAEAVHRHLALAAKRDTRRYTKRQVTWFRHQLPGWTWVAPQTAMTELARAVAAWS